MKLYVETKDNVKFLTMLERHFKNMSLGDLSTTLETIPSMMNSLRLIWVISHHCNKEGTRMLSLLCLIAEEIADQVAKLINIRAIFRRKYAHAMQTVQLGKKVLDSWKYTYKEVRSRIEHSDNNERWEFRPQDLFGRTEYMSKICDDLYKVAKTLDQLDKFLGKELRSGRRRTGHRLGREGRQELHFAAEEPQVQHLRPAPAVQEELEPRHAVL